MALYTSALSLPSLLTSVAYYNYFIGTVPALGSLLLSLDVRGNFLTDVPTASYTWCGCAGNCMTATAAAAKCISGGTGQRPAGDCVPCGTTNAVGPFCASTGGACNLDASGRITAGTVNSPSQPALPMACVGGTTVAIKESTAMLALKSSLGVTLTTWAATVPCQLAGQTTTAAVWNGVLCDSTGSVVSINLAQNLFNYRIDSFTTNLQSLPVLANLALHYNYLYGEVPSFLVGLPKLTALYPTRYECLLSTSRLAALLPLPSGAIYNYLIGTVPALASGLRSLNVRGNFLTDVPAATYTYCGGDSNCLLTPSKCATTGTTQRPAANCAVCGTTNGTGPFCAAGGVCLVDATASVAAGTVNSNSQPVLPLACSAPPVLVKESAACVRLEGQCIQAVSSRAPWGIHPPPSACLAAPVPACPSPAMLALKLELGVSFTTWAATVPCQLAGQAATVKVWTGVLCDSTGRVVSITLENTKLYGSLSTDISTLTALTYLNVLLPSLLAPRSNLPGNFFRNRLDSFTTSLRFLPLADIRLHYNFLYGEIPSFLMSLPKLTNFGAVYNYLIGTVPALASQLRSLDVRGNFLTDVPTANYTFCGCAGNCMLTPSKCISNGTAQRPAAQCAFCGTTNGVGPFCWGAGGECVADVIALWDIGILNSPSQPVQPRVCVGGSVQAIAQSAAMLALKSSLGVTFNSWAASVPCSVWVVSPSVPTWPNVICDGDGNVVRMSLSTQLFQAPLAAFSSNLLALTFLNELYLPYNWLYGSVPTALFNLQLLSVIDLSYNYLTGSFPASTTLSSLDIRSNFFYAVGTMTLQSCAAISNCLASPAACSSAGTTQRPTADCAICGSTNGQPPFCGGTGTCAPDSGPAAAQGTPNVAGSALLPMVCSGVAIDAADAAVLLALKSSLGVTLNNWNTAAPCTLEGQALLPAQWGGVRCTAAGKVTSIALKRQQLKGSIHPDISKLTTLTYLDFGYNLFQGRLDFFAVPLKPLTSLKALFFHYNYFAGSIPSAIATLPQLTSLGLYSNYLTGTVPIPSKALLALDVGFNFLSGVFPNVAFMFCAGENNCFVNSTNCRTYGSVQRPAGACAICGTAGGQGDLCFGGTCAPVASAAIAAGTINSPSQPILPMSCADNPAAPMDTGSAVALLNVKSALGVTFSTWAAASPCTIANSTVTVAGTWTGVLCSASGDVLSVNLSSSALAGSMHADITKLTALTYLDLSKNVLRANLASFVSSFSGLQALQQLRLNNNWFSGSLPQALMSLPALTLLDVHANALTGSLPAVSSTLAALFLHDNFLAGSFAAGALTACDASLNCLTSAAACGASSTTQRAAAACAICNSADAQGLLCWGGMCLPNVTATTAHPDGLAPPPMYCAGSPVVNISSVDAVALAALKSAMGVTFTTWAPATYCTVAPTPQIVGTWDGVLCNSLGKVVSLLLPNNKLTGTVPLAVSTLTALTAIDLTSNLLQGRLDEVATQLRLLTNLKSIDLAYNWLSGSVPAFMLTLPSLTKITLGYNYLTGALPPVTSPLAVVDVQFNFLGGTFPALTLSRCAARMNCFLDASKCNYPNRAAELPRAAAACAICNTTNAQGRLCSGGLCTVNATDLVALGAPNSAASPTLPLICVGAAFVAMDSVHAAAMLNLKASLGVTFTEWKADSPCSLPDAVAPGSWSGVACDATGKVLSIVLGSQKLAGSIHSDISKLTTLTLLDLQSNLLQGRLDSFTASIKTPLVLKELALQFNYLVGPFPSTLLALSTLSKLSVGYNYLTGPFPTVPASAKSLDVQGNFLSGSFPTNALTYCAATTNCLTDANNCASIGITQRTPSECAICGTSFGQGTLCGGVTCLVNTTGVTAPPTATSLPRNLYCTPVALDTNTTTTLLALKTVLGVTATDWSATTVALKPKALKSSSVPLATMVGACTIEGQTPAPGSWTGVFCNSAGAIVALVMPNQKLTGSLSADISKLTALTALDLSANLFQRGLDAFVAPLTAVKTLKSLSLQYNWFSSSIPSALLALPALSSIKLNRNYLTGVVPAVGAAVKALNVAGNFLSGSFPTTGLTACDARSNCFTDASKCTNTLGTAQRAATECNICGTTGAVGPFCGGGFCIPNAAAPAAAGTPNTEGQAVLAMSCVGGPIEVTMRGVMLNLKASLGVTLTDWVGTAPCNIAGQAPVAGSWSGVECDSAAKVTSINLTNQGLKGSLPSDIYKLTTLTSLVLDSNLLQGRLPYFTTNFRNLVALKRFKARFNFFSGTMPTQTLLWLPFLTHLDMSYNYLTGPLPSAIGTALKTLEIGGNFLSGAIGNFPGVACSAALNCLTSQGSCTTGGVQNRAGCNICGSADAQGTLCGGGLCVPNATAAVVAGQTPTLSTPVMPMYCTGVIMNTVAVAALLNIKTALGVTLSDWTAPTTLLKPKAAAGSGSVALTDWLTTGGYCTVEGQTAAPGAFSGVRCNALGQPVSLNLPFQKLTGSLHADLSKLSALTVLELSYNFLRAPVEPWASAIKLLTNLLSLKLSNNYLYGSVPLWLVSFAKLTNLELSVNALTGTFPAPISTALKRLMVDQNFLGGTFPANSATYCTAYYNCIPTYTTCNSLNPNAPNPSASCQICGMTDGLGTACMGNPCVPVTPSPITAINKWSPAPAMRCDPVPIQATQASALVAMTPGQWGAQTTCTLAGQPTAAGTSPSVYCNPAGLVLEIVLTGGKASGSFPIHVSKLSALTKLDLSANLFSGRLDSFLAPFLALKTLNSLRLHQNYFSGSFPTGISALTALTELRLNLNYLTGSMPAALPGTLKVIDLSSNYLVGTFPTTTATSVACASNCLQDASKCPAGSAQRAAGACAICETPDATGSMCNGGICTPTAATTVNNGTAALFCVGSSMDPAMAAALLNVKASMGLAFTNWALGAPCTMQGVPPLPGAWSNVLCSPNGKVVALNLAQQYVPGTMHADISKLTSLTYINVRTNYLEGRLDVFTTNFKALTALKEVYFDYNYFSGPIPSALVAMASLSTFGARWNYLYGAVPPLAPALKTLAVDGNWLSGTFPGAGFSSCSATKNCFASIGACTTGGTVQRNATTECAVCDSPDGTGTICGGGTCVPNTINIYPNGPYYAPRPRFCVGVALDATQGNILLALKTTLGATFSDWTAATLAAPKATSPKTKTGKKPKSGGKRRVLQGRGSMMQYDWKLVGSCTIQGQTPIAGAWTGVRCSPLGQVVALELQGRQLGGTVHSDISKLTTLTSLRLSSNLLFNRLDSYIVPITAAASLKELFINFNWFYGTVPTTLVNMAALSALALSRNYLTGTLPKPAATLKALDTEFNFLSGTFPAASLGYCTVRGNCFLDASACVNFDGTLQRGAGCNVCGSSNGQLPMCGGAVCTPDPSAYVAGKVANSASAPTLALKCPPLALDATSSAVLLKIGAALGVTHTDWSASSTCNIIGQTIAPKSFPGVWCSGSGAVVSLKLNNLKLGGTIHADMTKLTSLTYLHLGYNLLYGRLATFVSSITPLTTIVVLNLSFNYLYDSIPFALLNMPSLTEIGLSGNYLTGVLPSVSTKVQAITVANNLLAGTITSQAYKYSDFRNNCLSLFGIPQRTTGCAICGTTNAVPPLCSGAPCVLNATDALAAGTVNNLTAPLLPFYCGRPAIDATAAQTLLVLRAALGVSQSTWLLDSPCDVVGNPPMPGSWAGVGCDIAGQVVQLDLVNMGLRGSLPADLTKLTALTKINLASNLLEGRLAEWGTMLTTVKSLKHLALNYNWFSGTLPAYLLSLSTLTTLNVHYNYLTGYLAPIAATLKTINVASNFLAGPFPASSTTMCDARNNCLSSAANCVSSGSSVQRASCTICNGTAANVLCGGGVCSPNTDGQLASKTPNSATAGVLPMRCTGVRIDPAALPILANLKTALGVPHPGWGEQTMCTVSGIPKGPEDMPAVYCNWQGKVIDLFLKWRLMRGVMHPDISKLTGLTALDLSGNFLSGRLDPFITPLTGLAGMKILIMNYNFFSGSIPSTVSSIKNLLMLSLGWNYLTGTVPDMPPKLKVLDLEYNWLSYTFPTATTTTSTWDFCTVRQNCFIDPTPCGNGNIIQRYSCAVCGTKDANGTLCGGTTTCQPDPAAVRAATNRQTSGAPQLAITCPPPQPVATDATAVGALMNIKMALGLTYTDWASTSTCAAAGTALGGFTGVECNSLGNPVKITLDSQKLFGILHADITKLTALTFLSLKSNLFRARLDEFASKIPSLPNLAVLLLDFNWFYGSLPPGLVAMPKLTRLGLSYNYLTYRVPPLAAGLKDIDVGFNFLSGSFPANSATSCGANNNCFLAATTCATKGTAQRATGCSFCLSDTAQGMLCYGRGICTVDATAPFAAGTPNAVGATTLPLACI
ncbi:unnamed protein product, partial [Closterium sp. Naga37s-1]